MNVYKPKERPLCPICHTNRISTKGATRCYKCRFGKAEDPGAPPPRGYEEQWAGWLTAVNCARERYTGPSRRPVTIGRQRILILSDLHAPFHDPNVIAAAFEDGRDADLCIFAGDIGDFYSISRFIKYESVPFEEEAAALTLLIEQASQRFPRVVLIEGNHGQPRFEKQLRDRLSSSPDLIKIIEFLAGGNLSVLQAIARRYPNVEVAKLAVGRFSVDWLTQVGDLLVCHAEKFSKVPGSALRGLEEWLTDQERTLDLKPWRVVIQAHTHQLSLFPWHADKLLIESGCCCQTHGYQLAAKIAGRPQRRGWVTLEQVDGVTDVESIRVRWYDRMLRKAA